MHRPHAVYEILLRLEPTISVFTGLDETSSLMLEFSMMMHSILLDDTPSNAEGPLIAQQVDDPRLSPARSIHSSFIAQTSKKTHL